jgi:hypothetical protein
VTRGFTPAEISSVLRRSSSARAALSLEVSGGNIAVVGNTEAVWDVVV